MGEADDVRSRPPARVLVPLRLRPSSLARVERLSATLGLNRAETLRALVAVGLTMAEQQPERLRGLG
jgi:hypothetical protein